MSKLESLNKEQLINLLKFPDHLRATYLALMELEEATAEQVAEKTGKVRNLESHYLCQLVFSGHVEKHRRGRKLYFKIRECLEES